MPKMTVNECTLAYEVLGEGPSVVFTPGGRAGLEVTCQLAEQLSSRYRVLIYDRRNCGASEVSIAGSSSEWEIWADDVHALLERLDMSPAYVGGGSSGAALSLLVAHRHPKDVKGLLLLCPPTDDPGVHESLLHKEMYAQYAELAESKGMQAVVETPYYAERIEQNPANRERLLSMDPKEFATVMRRWNAFPTYGTHYFGLTDEMLSRAEERVMVPMVGFSRSYNISVAAALCMYHAYQWRSAHGGHGDLGPTETACLTASYYLRSVPNAAQILRRARRRG